MLGILLVLLMKTMHVWAENTPCGSFRQVNFFCAGTPLLPGDLKLAQYNLIALINPVVKALNCNRPPKLSFVLHTDFMPGDYPHTDEKGNIHLFQIPFLNGGDIEFGAAHELTHRILLFLRKTSDPFSAYHNFLEEGLAEHVAEKVQYRAIKNVSFPDFGESAGLVIAEWIRRKQFLPISKITGAFKRSSLSCTLQTYLEAKSYVSFLIKKCGVEAVRDLVVKKNVPNFGCGIEKKTTLEREWKAELLKTFPSNKRRYEGFLLRRPKGYFELCEVGDGK